MIVGEKSELLAKTILFHIWSQRMGHNGPQLLANSSNKVNGDPLKK